MARLRRFAVGDATLDVMQTEDVSTVGWGDFRILDEIGGRSGLYALHHDNRWMTHPLDRHKRILDALDRDPRFEKFLFRVHLGNREGIARAFKVSKEAA